MKIQRLPQGTRVRVRRGDYPISAVVEGREGIVVSLHRTRGSRYNVHLSGEEGLRAFDESELEVVKARASLEEAGAHQGGGGSDSPR